MYFKKHISLLLLSAMLLSMTACGAEQTETTAETTAVTETEAVETETEFSDGLPDVDCEGKVFRAGISEGASYEFQAEELTGEVENDAVYNRNARIEERFNVDVQTVLFDQDSVGAWYNHLIQSVTAGDGICDVAGLPAWNLHMATAAGVYQDWRSTKYIQFDKPWWNAHINDGATFNGKLLALSGTLSLSYLQSISNIYVNTDLLAEYAIDQNDIYSVVEEGKWTLDYMDTLVATLYQDVNGNGTRELDTDVLGYVAADWVALDVWPAAFDIDITSKGKDGEMVVELMSEKTHNALEKVYRMFYENEGAWLYEKLDYDNIQYFVSGNVVFYQSYLENAFSTLRDMDSPFGVLPQPKYDETQKNYRCLVMDGVSVWGLLTTVTDTEFVSLITDALCADTYVYVYPQFYDVAMKSKYSQDAATAAMVDIIVESASFDVSFMYGTYLEMLPYLFRTCLIEGKTDLASAYAAIETKVQNKLEQVYAQYK